MEADMSNVALNAPTELTDAELDVVAGGLVTVVATDLIEINNNDVEVAIPIAAGVGVLGAGVAGNITRQTVGGDTRPGRTG
jgi:hypothetical protein